MRWLGGVFASSRARLRGASRHAPLIRSPDRRLLTLGRDDEGERLEAARQRCVVLEPEVPVGRQQCAFGHRLRRFGGVDRRCVGQVGREVGALAARPHECGCGVTELLGAGFVADSDRNERRALPARNDQRLADVSGEPVNLQCGSVETELSRDGSRRADGEAEGVGRARDGTND